MLGISLKANKSAVQYVLSVKGTNKFSMIMIFGVNYISTNSTQVGTYLVFVVT